MEKKTSSEQALKYGTKIVIMLDDEEIEKIGLSYRDCASILRMIQKQLDEVIGEDIFPIHVEYYVDDVECKSLGKKKKRNSIFARLVAAKRQHDTDAMRELPSKAGVLYPLTRKDNRAEAVLCCDREGKNDGSLEGMKIVSYHKDEKIMLEMTLQDILSDVVLDNRWGGYSALHPIDFYYRGMPIPYVKQAAQMPYPCWSIKAHGYFGKAFDYLMISRHQLIADKIPDVYDRVARCADRTLRMLFSELRGNKSTPDFLGRLSLDQRNALTLSLHYYQTTASCAREDLGLDGSWDRLRHELFNRDSCRIAVVNYETGRFREGELLLREAMREGDESHWLVHENSFVSREDVSPIDAARKTQSKPIILVQDIFSGYLTGRGLIPKMETLLGFSYLVDKATKLTEPSNLVLAYKLGGRLVCGATGGSWIYDSEFYMAWLKEMVRFLRQRDAERDQDCLEKIVVLPAFAVFQNLVISNLPSFHDSSVTVSGKGDEFLLQVPESMACVKRFFVVPLSYGELAKLVASLEAAINSKDMLEALLEATMKPREGLLGKRIADIKDAVDENATWYERNTRWGRIAQDIFECQKEGASQIERKQIGDTYEKVLHTLLDDIVGAVKEVLRT